MRLYFDLEGNGLLNEITKIWCIAAIDLDSDEEHFYGPGEIRAGVEFLESADYLCGHNVLRYDIPVLKKLAKFKGKQGQTVTDTIILARVKYPNIKVTDGALVASGKLHSAYHGKDSLAAWAMRIGGSLKFSYEGGFDAYNEEMGDYCRQDVRAGKDLWAYLNPHETIDPFVIQTEHRITEITFLMEEAGWLLDHSKATALHALLVTRGGQLEAALSEKYGSWEELEKTYVAKKDNAKRGVKKGDTVTNYKTVMFNPGSRAHIEKVLTEAGWVPHLFTEGGRAKLDETVLEGLYDKYPDARDLVEYLLIQKRRGALAEGDRSWLKQIDKSNFLHPSYNPMGTVTGRASHFNPNIAQVPKVGTPYGDDCRELFTVPDGWSQVGSDFEGLELRCFAHFLGAFDGGAYSREVVDGDVHWLSCQRLGLIAPGTVKDPTNAEHKRCRDIAKTFIYAFLYGAGVGKISKILGCSPGKARKRLDQFMLAFPALRKLRNKVKLAATKGYLKGLDGRHIPVRAEHAALNSLLQSMGAVLCKNWVIDAFDALIAEGLDHGYKKDFVFLGWIHDEIQVAVAPHVDPEYIGRVLKRTAEAQATKFNLNVRLDASYVVGKNWKETH